MKKDVKGEGRHTRARIEEKARGMPRGPCGRVWCVGPLGLGLGACGGGFLTTGKTVCVASSTQYIKRG